MRRHAPEPEVELTIDSIAAAGDGVGQADGRAVFVPATIPGERVRVELRSQKRRASLGRLLEVLASSPDRAVPSCAHFGRCGGCQLQHMTYPAQLEAKRRLLERATSLPVRKMVASPEVYGYRSRVRAHLRGGAVGFFVTGSNELCAISQCPILDPVIATALLAARELAAEPGSDGEIVVEQGSTGPPVLVLCPYEEPSSALFRRLETLVARACIAGAVVKGPSGGLAARIGDPQTTATSPDGDGMCVAAGAFAQANAAVTALLARALVEGIEPSPTDRVLELHAGSGTFTLAVAPRVAEIVAVEADLEAILALEQNVAARAMKNVRVVRDDAARHAVRASGRFSCILVDPPRAGLPVELVATLTARRPRVIAYVSCNPQALGRDLARFTQHGYPAASLEGFDMFPQTAHLEALAILWPRSQRV